MCKYYRIRSSVALHYSNGQMEFFKTNIRENVVLQTPHNLIEFLRKFDGTISLSEIMAGSPFDNISVMRLVSFLHQKNILIEVDADYSPLLQNEQYRLINFLEEYCFSTKQVLDVLEQLSKKAVLIIGLGAVGTWVVDILARCGVRNFILVDNDKVELSNLHRQDFYYEADVGKYKLDCIEERLRGIGNIRVQKIYKIFDRNFFEDFSEGFCLAINCADFPNVDETTKILGEECMRRNIPHIVGGGYNLHLTLIGQSIIPFQTACYECFNIALREINAPYHKNLKKLPRKDRKIGSFAPLCTLSASITALEAFKILCGFYNRLTNTSMRIEFKIREMDMRKLPIAKDPQCPVCGDS